MTPLPKDEGMRVVSFVTQKGGSGKSTTAASIAVAAFQQGRRVFMLELDRQGTLSDWADARRAGEGPEFERIDAMALDKALATLKEAGYDIAIVDTPGVDSPATVAAMRAADLCLVPCRPTAAGQGVTEFNGTGAAAAEIRRLWEWIDEKLEGKRARHDAIALA
jgi:cellulose biosynthesis protein BcsQ